MIVDDRFIRVGSSNIANRSLGYDSECDVACDIEGDEEGKRAIARILSRLVSHFVGVSEAEATDAIRSAQSLAHAIDGLDRNTPRRLRPLTPESPSRLRSLVADYHIGDPLTQGVAWQPWKHERG